MEILKLLGIDEAGRGPVIGPMVMAGVLIHPDDEETLRSLGVKDSKLVPKEKRDELFDKVKELALAHKVLVISPARIDEAVESQQSNLNLLEAQQAARIINALCPDKAVLDCPSTNIAAFTACVRGMVTSSKTQLLCAHKADRDHMAVAAASILAKVTRDRLIGQLKTRIGVDFGSGYPSDPVTCAFVRERWNKHPDIFRRSWQTYKKVARSAAQSRLDSF